MIFNAQLFVIHNQLGVKASATYIIFMKFFEIIRVAFTNFTQILFPRIIYIEKENNWKQLKKFHICIDDTIISRKLINFWEKINCYGIYTKKF